MCTSISLSRCPPGAFIVQLLVTCYTQSTLHCEMKSVYYILNTVYTQLSPQAFIVKALSYYGPVVYTVYFTLFTVYCTVQRVYCTLNTVNTHRCLPQAFIVKPLSYYGPVVYTVYFTLFTVNCAVLSTLYTKNFTHTGVRWAFIVYSLC